MNATVNYECQTTSLPLFVVSGIGTSLMGHNWLEQLTLNWKDIHNINSDKSYMNFQKCFNQEWAC